MIEDLARPANRSPSFVASNLRLARNLFRAVGKGEFHVLFGRFALFRRTYSRVRGACQRFRGIRRGARNASAATLFDELDIEQAVAHVRRDGIVTGLTLPDYLVKRIHEHAEKAPCTRPKREESFHANDIRDGVRADGERVPIADVRSDAHSPDVAMVAGDPVLCEVLRRYLGYIPTRRVSRLYWSFPCEMPIEERRALVPALDFHFDTDNYNFAYVYFYLTDTDRDTGAHVVIKTSHRKKPLAMLFRCRFQEEREVRAYFGTECDKIIEGKRGSGFVTDASALHKALPPLRGRRLMLQIRYS